MKTYRVTIEKTYLTDNYKETEVKEFNDKKRALKFADKRDSDYTRYNELNAVENCFYYSIIVEEIKLIKVVCK